MRACFYARVSTEEEKQANALIKQCEEARRVIAENEWTLQKSCEYIDEGKSGTTTKNRDAYKRLYNDLDKNKFDVIVIKSQDRLMRSAKDWYIFLGKMTENKKQLYIYLEHRFYQPDDALITGIKAILAEEFSRELSKKLNNANRTRQRDGHSIITNGTMWGYDQRDGELYINKEEAPIVRRIFEMYCAGKGVRQIKNTLDLEGVVSRRGTQIGLTTLKRMIRNPAYMGTVIQNRTHHDFDTKQLVQNNPEEWCIHKNRVPPIVTEEVWNKANGIMDGKVDETPRKSRKGVHRGSYPLSSKIVCAECGASYRRTTYKEQGKLVPYWVCATYQQRGRKHPKGREPKEIGCDGRNIKEEVLYDALRTMANEAPYNVIPMMQQAYSELEKIIGAKTDDGAVRSTKKAQLIKSKDVLLDKLINGLINDQTFKSKNKEIDEKIAALNAQAEQAQEQMQTAAEASQRLKRISSILASNETKDEIKFRIILNSITRITVHPTYADIDIDLLGTQTIVGSLSCCDQYKTQADTLRIVVNLSKRYRHQYDFIIKIA